MTKKPSVDPAVLELAESFIADIPGATAEDAQELAEEIQSAIESFCRMLADTIIPERRREEEK